MRQPLHLRAGRCEMAHSAAAAAVSSKGSQTRRYRLSRGWVERCWWRARRAGGCSRHRGQPQRCTALHRTSTSALLLFLHISAPYTVQLRLTARRHRSRAGSATRLVTCEAALRVAIALLPHLGLHRSWGRSSRLRQRRVASSSPSRGAGSAVVTCPLLCPVRRSESRARRPPSPTSLSTATSSTQRTSHQRTARHRARESKVHHTPLHPQTSHAVAVSHRCSSLQPRLSSASLPPSLSARFTLPSSISRAHRRVRRVSPLRPPLQLRRGAEEGDRLTCTSCSLSLCAGRR